ncbi:preprotein translocase subunit SecE [bacterium]|nr:preprotein translocase subunit SecE [bacterium]
MAQMLDEIRTYLRGVKQEWGKVTWPEPPVIFSETLFVIVIIISFTVAILVIDLIYKTLFGLI